MIQTSRRCILSLIFVVVIYLLTAQPWKKTFLAQTWARTWKNEGQSTCSLSSLLLLFFEATAWQEKFPLFHTHAHAHFLTVWLRVNTQTRLHFFIPFFLSICRVIRAWWMMKNISFKERLCLSYMHACTISFIIEIYCGLKNLFDFQLKTAIFCFCWNLQISTISWKEFYPPPTKVPS